MRKPFLAAVLSVFLATPARSQSLPFQMFDWGLGGDPELARQIEKDYHLDPARLPHLKVGGSTLVDRGAAPPLTSSPSRTLILQNPGGAPFALAYAKVRLEPGTWTLRFRARVPSATAPVTVAVGFASRRAEIPVGAEWQTQAVSATLAVPCGMAAVSFSLPRPASALELEDVEFVRIPFEVKAADAGNGQVDLQLTGPVGGETSRVVEFRAFPMDDWRTPPAKPTVTRNSSGRFTLGLVNQPTLVNWRVVDAKGAVLHSGGQFRMGPPDAAPLAGIDSAGFMLKNGRRVLPLGLYCQNDRLKQCANLGLTLAIIGAGDDFPERMREAEKLGLDLIPGSGVDAKNPAPAVRKLVQRWGSLPLTAWAIMDEPEDKPAYFESLRPLTDALRSADARPLYQSIHNSSRVGPFLRWADINALDPYPISAVPRPLLSVANQFDEARALLSPGKALWYINQAFVEAPFWKRPPTPLELRAMTWLAFNHGARGLVFYSQDEVRAPGFPNYHWDLSKSELSSEIASEVSQLKGVQNYLLDGRGPIPNISKLWDVAEFPGPDGSRLLVVINADDRASQETLAVNASQIVEYPEGTPLGSGPQLPLSLGPYEVKLFLLQP